MSKTKEKTKNTGDAKPDTDYQLIDEDAQASFEKLRKAAPKIVKRAQKIGMSNEMISTYSDAAALQMACQVIKPQATSKPFFRKRPPPEMRIKGEPANITFTSEITEARAGLVNRVTYDEGQMNDFLRRERIDLRSIQHVRVDRNFEADCHSILSTGFIINYLK